MPSTGVEALSRVPPWRWVREHWSELAFIGLALALSAWVTRDAFTTRIVTLSQGTDYWEHSATLRALLDDPWHPQNPHLRSAASSPRFIPSFILSALVARAFGLDALGAMGVTSLLNLLLLLAGIHCFFRSYFRDSRAPFFGGIVMFGSWYDAWHFSNVYQLKILFSVVGYPSTAALGLSLLGFSITLRALRERAAVVWQLATVGIWALVMITHPLTAMLGFSGALLLAFTQPGIERSQRLKIAGAIVFAGLLSLLWPYFSVRAVLVGGTRDEVSALVREFADDGGSEASGRLHQFYRLDGLLRTLGVAVAGLPICLYLLLKRQHWFISLGAAAMLLPFAVNAYRPLPLGHRFILLAVFFLQVALVWLLLKFTRGAPEAWPAVTTGRRAWLSAGAIAAFLATLCWWNVEAAEQRLASSVRKLRGGESYNVRYARRVSELSGSNSVVLSDAQSSWPVPTFGARVVALWHPNPLVTDEAERNASVKLFFHPKTSSETRQQILQRYSVTHLLVKRSALRRFGSFLSAYRQRRNLPAGYVLYTLSPGAR